MSEPQLAWEQGWKAGVADAHASIAAKLLKRPDPSPTRNPYRPGPGIHRDPGLCRVHTELENCWLKTGHAGLHSWQREQGDRTVSLKIQASGHVEAPGAE